MELLYRIAGTMNYTFYSTFSFLHVSAVWEYRNMQERKGASIVINFNA